MMPDRRPQRQSDGPDDWEARYRIATLAVSDVIWDWDLRSNRVEWNRQLLSVFGYDPAAVSDSPEWWFGNIHPDDRPRVLENVADIRQSRERWSEEYRFLNAQGVYHTVQDQGYVLRDAAGQAVRLIGAMVDVTAQRAAQSRILELNRRLVTIAESTSDNILLVDKEWSVRYLNQRARTQLFSGHRTQGNLWACFPELVGTRLFAACARAFDSQESEQFEEYYSSFDAWFEVQIFPSRDNLTIFLRDVSERRRARAALVQATEQLEAAQTRLQRLIAISVDMVCTLDPNGKFVELSDACQRILGFAPEELTGRALAELLHPDETGAAAQFLEEVTRGPVRDFQVRCLHKRGGSVPLTLSAVWSEQDQLIFSIGRDITKRVKAEQQLEESRASLARAQLIAKLGSWSLVIQSGTLSCSEQTLALLGVTDPAALSRISQMRDMVVATDLPVVDAAVDGAFASRSPLDFEAHILTRAGGVRLMHVVAEFSRHPETGEATLFGTIQDITEHERAQEALQASEKRYRLLFEDNPQPIWVIDDRTLEFLAVNKAAVASYGYSEAEFLSMTMLDLIPTAELEAFTEFNQLGRQGAPPRHQRKDGSQIWVETTSHQICFSDREARLVLAIDVTERRNLEEQLRQIQKMEAVGQLAGGIAHDFNNLLTIINGYSSLLQMRLSDESPMYRDLGHILEAGQRAAALTSQLLAFSRRQVLQPKPLNLNQVLSGMRPILRRLISEDIEIITVLDPQLQSVHADPTQFEQVILNLAINARDAMPRGGRLTIETANVYLDSDYAQAHPESRSGHYVVLSVSDNGEGMTPEVRAHLFEPFFTTKEKGRGTGLGLPTVYGIVRQSGGNISVYSEPGIGSTFKVYLPTINAAPDTANSGNPRDVSYRTGSETVLIVEDDPGVREFAISVLSDHGYKVVAAAGSTEAITAAEALNQPLDLLLTDVVLPRLNGRELAQALTPRRPEMKVLFMSGYTENAIVNQGVLEPGLVFIAKPFTPDALLRKVREVLDAPRRRRSIVLVAPRETGVDPFVEPLEAADCQVTLFASVEEAVASAKMLQVDLLFAFLPDSGLSKVGDLQKLRRAFAHARIVVLSNNESDNYAEVARLLGADRVVRRPDSPAAVAPLVRDLLANP